jgi:CRISPR-associated protein Cst2
MTTQVYSLSISSRMTLDMHSLNNEGGEGNQIQTRMVNIVDEGGRLQNVNAISGDMFKHIQAEHLFKIATANPQLPLCAGCRTFNANRINADTSFLARTKGLTDSVTVDELLRTCAIDDIEGILITADNRSIPRKSVIEFGWVVGVPGSVETDSYFHVKYASERDEEKRGSDREAQIAGANLGQNIFHRPASSGIYAAVCHLEIARIGFNDIRQTYALNEEQRSLRARALLESVLYTFLQPNGAMRSTQAPHVVNIEGALTVSASPMPAPTVSPLKAAYRDEINRTTTALQSIAPNALAVYEFNDLSSLTEIVSYLIQNTTPYTLQYQ